jgi:hypothetical protein
MPPVPQVFEQQVAQLFMLRATPLVLSYVTLQMKIG